MEAGKRVEVAFVGEDVPFVVIGVESLVVVDVSFTESVALAVT